MEYRVMPIKYEFINGVVKLHCECFFDSFSTELGNGFLKYMYLFSVYDQYSISFLAVNKENEVIGFVQGTSKTDGYNKRFLNMFKYKLIYSVIKECTSSLKLLIKLITKKRTKVFKFISNRQRSNTQIEYFKELKGKCSSIKSICVLPSYKGKGIAEELFNKFEEESIKQECNSLILSVKKENFRAIKFYTKMGMELHWESPNTEGSKSQGYIKYLGEI